MGDTDNRSMKRQVNEFKLSLSLNTLGHLDYESQLRVAAQAGWRAVGFSMRKMEEYLAPGKTIEDVKALFKKYNVYPVEMMGFRHWIGKKGKEQMEMADLFRTFSRISKQLGNPMLLTPTLWKGDFDSSLAKENFKEICQIAAGDENQVGLEFIPYSPVDTIRKAWDIVKSSDLSNGGIVLDVFHYFKGKSLLADLEEVPIEKIFYVHTSDLRTINPEEDLSILSLNYRVLPGEGNFIFDDILQNLFSRGYSRYYSLEVLNKDYPREDSLRLANRARESLRNLLENYQARSQ